MEGELENKNQFLKKNDKRTEVEPFSCLEKRNVPQKMKRQKAGKWERIIIYLERRNILFEMEHNLEG